MQADQRFLQWIQTLRPLGATVSIQGYGLLRIDDPNTPWFALSGRVWARAWAYPVSEAEQSSSAFEAFWGQTIPVQVERVLPMHVVSQQGQGVLMHDPLVGDALLIDRLAINRSVWQAARSASGQIKAIKTACQQALSPTNAGVVAAIQALGQLQAWRLMEQSPHLDPALLTFFVSPDGFLGWQFLGGTIHYRPLVAKNRPKLANILRHTMMVPGMMPVYDPCRLQCRPFSQHQLAQAPVLKQASAHQRLAWTKTAQDGLAAVGMRVVF